VSTAEIKASIDRMSDDERFFAAAYLHHLARASDPGWQLSIKERMDRMNAGQKVSFEQVERVHGTLESERL
jgi:hypothetical protein